jgi:hypothetical protein
MHITFSVTMHKWLGLMCGGTGRPHKCLGMFVTNKGSVTVTRLIKELRRDRCALDVNVT